MSHKSKNAYTRFSKSYIKRWQELYTFAEKMFAEVEKYSYLKANTRLKGRKGFGQDKYNGISSYHMRYTTDTDICAMPDIHFHSALLLYTVELSVQLVNR